MGDRRLGFSGATPAYPWLLVVAVLFHGNTPAYGQEPRVTKIGSDVNPLVDMTGRQLQNANFFGVDVAALGELDKDGVPDLAVGARGGNDTKSSIWILFLNSDGSVK